jgi:hypothetical protein
MPYIILRGRWSDIIVLNVRTPAGDKNYDDTMDSFCGNNVYSINSLNTIYIFYEISMPKQLGKTFSSQQLGMGLYTKLVMIMELE